MSRSTLRLRRPDSAAPPRPHRPPIQRLRLLRRRHMQQSAFPQGTPAVCRKPEVTVDQVPIAMAMAAVWMARCAAEVEVLI